MCLTNALCLFLKHKMILELELIEVLCKLIKAKVQVIRYFENDHGVHDQLKKVPI